MNAMTARGLSLAAVVAVWTAISHFGKLPLQLWPVIVGIGCFVAAGGDETTDADNHRPQLQRELSEVRNRGPHGHHRGQTQSSGGHRVHRSASFGVRMR